MTALTCLSAWPKKKTCKSPLPPTNINTLTDDIHIYVYVSEARELESETLSHQNLAVNMCVGEKPGHMLVGGAASRNRSLQRIAQSLFTFLFETSDIVQI